MALLATEGRRRCAFTDGAIGRIADFATLVNERTENIGARRLHTVMEKLLDEVSFEAPDLADKDVTIDEAYVERMLADIVEERRPVALHPVMMAVRDVPRRVDGRTCALSLRARRGVRQEGAAAGAAASGARAADRRSTVRRAGPDGAGCSSSLPATNANGPGPSVLDRVEIYAVTVAPGMPAPPNRELLTPKYLVGTIAVKPPPVEGEPAPPTDAPPDTRPSAGRHGRRSSRR